MLQDEQAAELLARCENILGHELINIRGELAKAQGRAGAVWELLSIEAADEIGALEHAPDEGSRPDICLRIHSSQPIYIEVTFLHERFAENYRKERQVDEWLKEEARKRNISQSKVTCTFSLDKNHSRVLPDQHEKKIFLQQPEVQKFFGYIS